MKFLFGKKSRKKKPQCPHPTTAERNSHLRQSKLKVKTYKVFLRQRMGFCKLIGMDQSIGATCGYEALGCQFLDLQLLRNESHETWFSEAQLEGYPWRLGSFSNTYLNRWSGSSKLQSIFRTISVKCDYYYIYHNFDNCGPSLTYILNIFKCSIIKMHCFNRLDHSVVWKQYYPHQYWMGGREKS